MQWANELLSVDVRNPQASTYAPATITFGEWHERITSRAQALLDAKQTAQVAETNYQGLLAQRIPINNPIETGADLEIYMRSVEQLESARALAKATADDEKAVVTTLQTELFKLANIRLYKDSPQPCIKIDLDGIPWLVVVHSSGEIDILPYNASAALPVPR